MSGRPGAVHAAPAALSAADVGIAISEGAGGQAFSSCRSQSIL